MFRNFVRQLHGKAYTIRLSKDEMCFLAHHPDTQHDYKYTKPIPKEANDKAQSMLKVDSKHMVTRSPNLEQLQALTYTPARYWHQYPGRAKRQRHKDYFNDKEE